MKYTLGRWYPLYELSLDVTSDINEIRNKLRMFLLEITVIFENFYR